MHHLVDRLARRRRLLAAGTVVIVAALFLFWLAFGRRDATLEQIEGSGVWRVGMDPSFPPFENLNGATGQPAGFDVDLVQAIAQRWGVRVEFVGVGFDQLLDAVTARKVDAAVSALPLVEWRSNEVSFSDPYFEAGLVLVVPRGSPILTTSDLAGRRVAVEWGSEGDAAAHTLQAERAISLTVVVKESSADALAAIAQGEADAALTDAVSLALYHGADLVAAGPPLRSDPYVIYLPPRSPSYVQAVNLALAQLKADGTIEETRARWFGK